MKCTFCGKEIPEGHGTIYAKKDGTTYYFCSKKCRHSLLTKKHKAHKTKWTNEYHLKKERHLKHLNELKNK
jgi:large subunit ribosomal protein L24e